MSRISRSILHRFSASFIILSPPNSSFHPQSRKWRENTDLDGGAEDNHDLQFQKAALLLADARRRRHSYINLADPKKVYEILTGQRKETEETSSSLSRLLPQPTHQPLFNPIKLPAISACMPPLGLIGKTDTVKIDSFCTGLAFTADDDSHEITKYVVLYTDLIQLISLAMLKEG